MARDSKAPRTLSDAEIEALRTAVLERAEHMSEGDLKGLLDNQADAEQRANALQDKLPGFVKQVTVGFSMVRDYWKGDYRNVPWWSMASVAAGLAYFVAPIDLIPDFIPLIGYLDDAAVLAAVMQGIKQDLRIYCEAKGIRLDD
jgi:uncharacterized membrane protein YkvA (DUF1232 family)